MKTIPSLIALLFLIPFIVLLADDTKPVPEPALEAIRYERTGGNAGTHDVIEITPDGAVTVKGRRMGNAKGQLNPEQITKLIVLFTDWNKLKSKYPAPRGAADDFHISIRYGTITVSGRESNANLPASFKAARSAIEKIARELTKK